MQDSEVNAPSGPTREHRLLDNAARHALSTCAFTPALLKDGTPIASVIAISYAWTLE